MLNFEQSSYDFSIPISINSKFSGGDFGPLVEVTGGVGTVKLAVASYPVCVL